jgi:hypothetical protein
MNVRGETTKPVENVQWIRGGAPAGRYRVFVHNYRFHESPGPTEFRVEVEINGKVQHFEGTIAATRARPVRPARSRSSSSTTIRLSVSQRTRAPRPPASTRTMLTT